MVTAALLHLFLRVDIVISCLSFFLMCCVLLLRCVNYNTKQSCYLTLVSHMLIAFLMCVLTKEDVDAIIYVIS